ncbi:hypothetical protein [Streptomyces sp900116325]|uniref:hypothetical protein n=1 Tax=Streptomyces sp. 900116325 TaxID=3154295 RepID=UPI00332BCC78
MPQLPGGLPSASGDNDVVLGNARTYVATINDPGSVAPDAGRLLSQYWRSAAHQPLRGGVRNDRWGHSPDGGGPTVA